MHLTLDQKVLGSNPSANTAFRLYSRYLLKFKMVESQTEFIYADERGLEFHGKGNLWHSGSALTCRLEGSSSSPSANTTFCLYNHYLFKSVLQLKIDDFSIVR